MSVTLSICLSKYTPGERTSCETTTRSVPLITNVPLGVIIGKSPMKTVWLLISPVVLLVNSAVTNSGAANVMSLSLHSSTEYLVGSNRWSRKLNDMEPEKSSIGEISSKISSRPEEVDRSSRPASMPSWTRACQASLPTSQSKEVVWRCRRFGTSRGSRIFAKETREVVLVLRGSELKTANREVLPAASNAAAPTHQAAHAHSTDCSGHPVRAVI